MCVSAEKSIQDEGINPPELRKKPVAQVREAISCARPHPTLIERVVDFIDTYNGN